MKRRAVQALAVLGLVALLWGSPPAPAAFAQPTPALTVFIVEASNGPGGVDKEVRHIYKRMAGSLGYSTFRLISTVRHSVALGEEKIVLVPGNRQLVLRPTAITGNHLTVNVEVRKRDARPMRVTGHLARGGTFVVGGYPHARGRLVFAISATF